MRKKERIKPFLDTFIKTKTLEPELIRIRTDINLQEIVKYHYDIIKEFWENNPDYRFTQVLITMNIYPNSPGVWFYWEDDVWFPDYEDKREVICWGSYGKSGKEKLKIILLPYMKTDHIETILKTQIDISKQFEEIFEKELQWRKENNVI